MTGDTLRVGITCYPSVGGSGVLWPNAADV